MKALFDTVSFACSVKVTKAYSTSFSSAVKMLAPSIRQDIYNIYGFVRFADEIVDSFHDYNKELLFEKFEKELEDAIKTVNEFPQYKHLLLCMDSEHLSSNEIILDDCDVRELLKVSRRTLLDYRKTGKLLYYKIENTVYKLRTLI